MISYRINISDFAPITKVMKKGTAAEFMGVNKKNGKKGIHKINSCMLGINNEDVREKLASDIFHKLGIPCAEIDLVYDEAKNENSCFSNYVIKDSEVLVCLESNTYNVESFKSVKAYIEGYCTNVRKIPGVTESKIPEIRKNLAQMLYMDCIIDHYDRKNDNTAIICSKRTGMYKKVSPWYDYELAFAKGGIQKNGIFITHENEEIMKQLFENYFEDIHDLYKNTKQQLTPENVNIILKQPYCVDNFSENQLEIIKNNLNGRILQATNIYEQISDKKATTNDEETHLVENKTNLFQKVINKFIEKYSQIKNSMMLKSKDKEEN